MGKCPKCNNTLSQNARFCDQCGASLESAAGVPAAGETTAAVPQGRSYNWTGFVILAAVIAVTGWLLFGPKGGDDSLTGTKADSSTAANPHGGMDMNGATNGGAMENPHGGETGDSPHGGGGMDGLQASLSQAKATLAENPLDVPSLQTLYQSYGTIGRAGQLRPYLESALAEIERRKGTDGESAIQDGKNATIAAMLGGDPDGAAMVLQGMLEIWPEHIEFESMIGDAYSTSARYDEGIEWYTNYIETADSEDELYWNSRIKRAKARTMRYEQDSEDDGAAAGLEAAVSEYLDVTAAVATSFQAWLGLGAALKLSGRSDDAVAAWHQALKVTDDAIERWAAESAIAEAEGREAPPRPGVTTTSNTMQTAH